MARPIRLEVENGCYHVVARGNERQNIFRSDEDRILFLKTCEQMVERFGVVLHAYCLMPNHYHLAVSTPRANLSQSIGWLQTTYTIRFNRKYHRSGHLYQGRFKAHLVEADEYAQVLVPYIHLNPVRPKEKKAEIAPERIQEFERYPWSSHWEYTGRRNQVWINLDWLSYWGRHLKEARKGYQREVRQYFGKVIKSPWDTLKGGLLLGSQAFIGRMKERLEKKAGDEEIKWVNRARQEEIQRIVEGLVKEEPDRRIQIWLLARIGGRRMVDIAKRYGYKDGSGVLQAVKRLEQLNDKAVQRRLKNLKRNLSSVKS